MEMDFTIESLDVLKIKVRLSNGTVKEYDVEEELRVTKEDLDTHFIEQSGKYAWWGVLAEVAKSYKEEQEAELDRIEAEADNRVREQLELDGIKITESIVSRNIKLDEQFKAQQKLFIKAKRNAQTLDRIVKAFDQRLDSLISLGANLRKEENNSDVKLLQEKAKGIISNR